MLHVHPLIISFTLSILAGLTCYWIIPKTRQSFIQAGLKGIDLSKKEKIVISESMGAICGLIYLLSLFLLLPFAFMTWLQPQSFMLTTFTLNKFSSFLSALLSIQSMLFLGFADDVLNIKWRYKLFLPAFASIPLLFVYAIESNVTWVVVPSPLRSWLGQIIHLGPLYYLYMIMMAIFCTNSINILAGINGIEAGQSLVIALTMTINSLFSYFSTTNAQTMEVHLLSLYLLLPFIAVTLALLKWNWYPARVFVGDTYAYFAGMVIAVSAILGHFSKTTLLFLIPQIFNFLFSVPQLFGILPCPRHRLPSYDPLTDLLRSSQAIVPSSQISKLGHFILLFFRTLGLCKVEKVNTKENPNSIAFTNFTLINLVLVIHQRWNPNHRSNGIHERKLTLILLYIQVTGCIVGLILRHGFASLVYP